MRCLGLLRTLSLNLLFLFLAFSSQAATVLLKGEAKVSADEVLLKDIAKIEAPSLALNVLSQIPVKESPPLCKSYLITKREIVDRIVKYLQENGISFSKIEVKGPQVVKVNRPCYLIDGESFKRKVIEFFKENYPEIVVLSVPSISFRLPFKNYDSEISLVSLGRNYARVVYKIVHNGSVYRKFWISVRIDRKVKVVVAKISIPRGTLIEESMVKISQVPSSKARGALPDLNEVIGKVSRRDILPGDVIKERDLSPLFLVKRGQPVKVIYVDGPIHIELLGVSLENGAVGNIIRVKNLSTGKVLRCKVLKDGSVLFVSD